jgi:hypothetical protein
MVKEEKKAKGKKSSMPKRARAIVLSEKEQEDYSRSPSAIEVSSKWCCERVSF